MTVDKVCPLHLRLPKYRPPGARQRIAPAPVAEDHYHLRRSRIIRSKSPPSLVQPMPDPSTDYDNGVRECCDFLPETRHIRERGIEEALPVCPTCESGLHGIVVEVLTA
jgi:hypothetical protein